MIYGCGQNWKLKPNGRSEAKNNYGNRFLVSKKPYVHTHHAYIMKTKKIDIFPTVKNGRGPPAFRLGGKIMYLHDSDT